MFFNCSTGIPLHSGCHLSALWKALCLDGSMASLVAENILYQSNTHKLFLSLSLDNCVIYNVLYSSLLAFLSLFLFIYFFFLQLATYPECHCGFMSLVSHANVKVHGSASMQKLNRKCIVRLSFSNFVGDLTDVIYLGIETSKHRLPATTYSCPIKIPFQCVVP
jgi:hypothetical protein